MTYKEAKTQVLLDKLLIEFADLQEKFQNLSNFIDRNIHLCADGQERIYLRDEQTNMSAYHTGLLKKQQECMESYLLILKDRIDYLTKGDK